MKLHVGDEVAEVPDSLVRAASPFGFFDSFALPAHARADVLVTRESVSGGQPIIGPDRTFGRYEAAEQTFRVDVKDDALAAMCALRALWHDRVTRAGGLLLHASGIAFGERAVMAVGPSGQGKSTFARLCVETGGVLLSDEIIAVLKNARVDGTPFKSDLELPGVPGVRKLAAVLLLEKAAENSLTAVTPAEAAKALFAQTFRPKVGALSAGDALERLQRFVASVPVLRYGFRKERSAAELIRAKVDAGAFG